MSSAAPPPILTSLALRPREGWEVPSALRTLLVLILRPDDNFSPTATQLSSTTKSHQCPFLYALKKTQ